MGTSVRRALEAGIGRDGRAPRIDVGASREEHGRPETGPPGGLVDVLSRWETQGGHWRVANETEAWLTVGLMSCDGEEMSRVTGSRTAVLTAFLDGRTTSAE
jgi:hypothetical protein